MGNSVKKIFVTGIDTGVGKTLVSALLMRCFQADYWKPFQCGDLDNSDSRTVKNLVSKSYRGKIHPEAWQLKAPQSPHIAAAAEGLSLSLEEISLPETKNHLIVEGAGGVLVPLNKDEYIIDIASKFSLSVIVVIKPYLGCFNHTLMTYEALLSRGLSILGFVVNGDDSLGLAKFLENKTHLPILCKIPDLDSLTIGAIDNLSLNVSF